MTTFTSPTMSSKRSGGLPMPVAIGVIALAVGLGGWGVWRFWTSLQFRSGEVVVKTDEPPSVYRQSAWADRMRVQAVNQMNAPDYVRGRSRAQGGGWEVKGNRTRLVIVQGGNNQLRLTAEPMDPNFISAEQRTLLALRARAGSEDAVARQLEITPEQRERLNAIPRGTNYTIEPGMRQRLTELFRAWESAPENARQAQADALIAAVRELEAAQMEVTRRSVAERVEQIRRIVTPGQIQAFEQMGRGGR